MTFRFLSLLAAAMALAAGCAQNTFGPNPPAKAGPVILDPKVEAAYMKAVRKHVPAAKAPERVERFAFYDRAKTAFAVVMTGETAKYGNIILKKGVTPV